MTPEAKKALSKTIRGLRERLLEDLHAATESAYRLSVRTQDAGLAERPKALRRRLEAWIGEQQRAEPSGRKAKTQRCADDFRREAEKQAAYTFLNRLVILKLMEAPGPSGEPMRKPPVVTGGWESRAYKDFRQLAPALVREDETAGYGVLLRLVFEELAVDLPGVFGPAGVGELVPIPAGTLRHAVEELDRDELESCWTDDMTLGWVYQYWNDPEREALDAKVGGRGKIEAHEVASKTQFFSDRYIVEWLLQNTLGPEWIAMCKKHGWIPEVEAGGTLVRLEERRAAWRGRRRRGEVEPTALMPLDTVAESRWVYYVPRSIPEDAVERAAESVRELKLLDPAVGSGHFLVVAMDLLLALYREEARHRGEQGQDAWNDVAIVEQIVANNLHGIDLDPRAVQIAAAALWLKAQQLAPGCRPERMNLVASDLRLASLPDDDAALVELRKEVERETGIPAKMTDTVVHALRGADHLGSLLKVDTALERALADYDSGLGTAASRQGNLSTAALAKKKRPAIARGEARGLLLKRLEEFLARRTAGDDLGLRLRGEQLASGVRFVRMLRPGYYDFVVANPPYHSPSKMTARASAFQAEYPSGRGDLFAAFILRGFELLRSGGRNSTVTLGNWMFLKAFADFRSEMLRNHRLCVLGDLGKGAFSAGSKLISASVQCFQKLNPTGASVAIRPYEESDVSTDERRVVRNVAALRCHVGRHEFEPAALKVVPEWPLVYWWDEAFLLRYEHALKLGADSDVKQGMATADNARFLRLPWEVRVEDVFMQRAQGAANVQPTEKWVPYIKGAAGQAWFEPLNDVVRWFPNALAIKLVERNGKQASRPQNENYYFRPGGVLFDYWVELPCAAEAIQERFRCFWVICLSERWGCCVLSYE